MLVNYSCAIDGSIPQSQLDIFFKESFFKEESVFMSFFISAC